LHDVQCMDIFQTTVTSLLLDKVACFTDFLLVEKADVTDY